SVETPLTCSARRNLQPSCHRPCEGTLTVTTCGPVESVRAARADCSAITIQSRNIRRTMLLGPVREREGILDRGNLSIPHPTLPFVSSIDRSSLSKGGRP